MRRQVLVLPDALGLNPGFSPRFLKHFAELADLSRHGVREYISEVKGRKYPPPSTPSGMRREGHCKLNAHNVIAVCCVPTVPRSLSGFAEFHYLPSRLWISTLIGRLEI